MPETRMPHPHDIDERDFKVALSQFASGVTVITTLDESGAVHGMTATAFCSLSLRPPLVLVAIALGTRCHRHLLAQRRFGVSVLDENQTDLSRHFGGRPLPAADPRFRTLADVAVLAGSLVTLACHLETQNEGGDHSIFTGRVVAIQAEASGRPLIHFDGRYRRLAPDPDEP